MPPAYVKPYVKRQKNDATDPVGNLIRVARTARIECPTVNPIRLASDSESGNAFARWLIFAD